MIIINLIPNLSLFDLLLTQRQESGRHQLKIALSNYLANRFVKFPSKSKVISDILADHSDESLQQVCKAFSAWSHIPNAS